MLGDLRRLTGTGDPMRVWQPVSVACLIVLVGTRLYVLAASNGCATLAMHSLLRAGFFQTSYSTAMTACRVAERVGSSGGTAGFWRGALLETGGVWEESLKAYRQVDRGPVSAIREKPLLVRLNRPVEALLAYRRTGVLQALQTYAPPNRSLPPDSRYADVADLFVQSARWSMEHGRPDAALDLARESESWTNDGKILGNALALESELQSALGRHHEAAVAAWLSVAVSPPGDPTDQRYTRLCQTFLSWKSSQEKEFDPNELIYQLRCNQRVGKHQLVVDMGRRWLAAHPELDRSKEDRLLLDCVIAESLGRPEAGCLMPFDGDHEVDGMPQRRPFVEYPVQQVLPNGRFLVGVALHPVDLDMGLPVATEFYWKETSRIVKTFARLPNLTPDPGFEYARILEMTTKGPFGIGYERDIYHAPALTRRWEMRDADFSPTALFLENLPAGDTSASSGLMSYLRPIDKHALYLQGGRIYGRKAGLLLGRAWLTDPSREAYSYAAGAAEANWSTMAAVVQPPNEAVGCAIWLLNYRSAGIAGFDQLFFIPIPSTIPPPGVSATDTK